MLTLVQTRAPSNGLVEHRHGEVDHAILGREAQAALDQRVPEGRHRALGSAEPEVEAGAGLEPSEVDALLAEAVAARGRQPNLSFFAFTATPKGRTLELFGKVNASGRHEPFHLYPMRQAIEEGFICDVLAGYVTYKVGHIHNGLR